jgi:hypothetical protein
MLLLRHGSGLVPAILFMILAHGSQDLDLLLPSLAPRRWGVCLRVDFVNDCVGCAVGVRLSPPSGTPGLGPAWASLGQWTSPPSGGQCHSSVYWLFITIPKADRSARHKSTHDRYSHRHSSANCGVKVT